MLVPRCATAGEAAATTAPAASASDTTAARRRARIDIMERDSKGLGGQGHEHEQFMNVALHYNAAPASIRGHGVATSGRTDRLPRASRRTLRHHGRQPFEALRRLLGVARRQLFDS